MSMLDLIFGIIFIFALIADIKDVTMPRNEKTIMIISDVAFIIGTFSALIPAFTNFGNIISSAAVIFMVFGWIEGFHERKKLNGND